METQLSEQILLPEDFVAGPPLWRGYVVDILLLDQHTCMMPCTMQEKAQLCLRVIFETQPQSVRSHSHLHLHLRTLEYQIILDVSLNVPEEISSRSQPY